MVKEKEAFLSNVTKIIDALSIILAFVFSYFVSVFIRHYFGLGEMAFAKAPDLEGLLFFTEKNAILIFSSIPIWLFLLSIQGAYKELRTKTIGKQFEIILKSSILTTITLGSLIFIFKMTLTSRLFIAITSIVTIILLIGAKILLNRFFDYMHKKGYNQINLLIVGTGKRAQEFIKVVKNHSNWGLRIVGLIDDEHGMFGKDIEGFRVLGRLQDIPFILHRIVVDRVIFVVPRLWLNRIDEAILACEREGISTSISMDLYNLRVAKVRQTDFYGFPLLEFETFSAKQWQLFFKRVIDILLSLTLLLLFSPLIIVAIIAIKLESKGPVLFSQVRSGLNGRKFKLYKFRTMVVGAEMKKRELEKMNEMDGPVFKIRHDPRITRVGAILRKTSIDEIPQLINVLKGDMSIVGPRPPLPVEVELYKMWQRRRLSLKPGLTCIWQVSGRNRIQFEKWMEMDLEYIDKWSLWLDFKILFKTVFVVLFGYGAS
ncbi:sugar transferase [candidate division KSB1 bacterium]|nr:sugar transferase [candidate division KSB1 bacterium]NIR72170.1 sugar transferase [candidate division KSB1 bacterium]NIS26635.1 sugar transferase [candidate division KSB1 bacterium]NIT73403.1 sugar transferase [candidate division KSB1 bacterium]NIU27251.1 sugar transferase [candidate division KSB1 bacterium]